MQVLAGRGCEVSSKNKDKTFEEADKARARSCRIGAFEEALAKGAGERRKIGE
jgi:hypothetical protein